MAQAGMQDVKTLLDSYVQCTNKRDLDCLMDCFTDDCVRIDALVGKLQGKDAVKGFYATLFSAFPDLRFTIDNAIAADDTLAIEWRLTGTHQGPFPPFEDYGATGKKVVLSGATFCDLRNGKIAVERVHADFGSLVEQLGIAPPMRRAA